MRHTPRLAVLAVGVLLFAACSNPHLSGGKLHFDQKRFDRAEENFAKAVQEAPDNGEAYMFLAMAQAELGKTEEAAGNFSKASELAPRLEDQIQQNRDYYFGNLFNSAVAFSEKAEELKAQGDQAGAQENYQNGLGELQKALVYRPNHPQALSNLGVTYLKLGQIDTALSTFDELSKVAGDDPEIKNTLLLVYSGQGNESFQRAIELRESDAAESRRYLDAALVLYEKALAIDPNDIESRQNQAAVSWELADVDETRRDELLRTARGGYEAVLALEPDNMDVLKNLALLASAMNDSEASLQYATQLVDSDPKDPASWIQRGRILGQMEKKTEMFGNLLVGQALTSGMTMDAANARTFAEAHGPRSQQLDRYRESGEPEEVRKYTDTGGGSYEIWLYWSRGRVYAFQNGKELYAGEFQKIETETEQ